MSLNNTEALTRWAEDENPSEWTFRAVAAWVFGLGDVAWREPSWPLSLGTGDPWEIRVVVVPGTGVEVIWEHEHATGMVNLLDVRTTGTD